MTHPAAPRQRLFSVIIVFISITFGLTLVDYALGWYRQYINNSSNMDTGLIRYDPQLGWKLSSNWSGKHEHFDFNVSYKTDSTGFRKQPLFHTSPINKKVALVGDSFTFGFGVNDDETFGAQLARSNPQDEYINLGIPGYSTDQEYLLIKQYGKTNKIDHYILMFYLGNDILDNALPHPLQAEPSKPYFEEQNDELMLRNVPVPQKRKTAALKERTFESIIFGDQLKLLRKENLFEKVKDSSELLQWLLPDTMKIDKSIMSTILIKNLSKQRRLLLALFLAIKNEAIAQQAKLTIAILPGKSYISSPLSYSHEFQEYVRKTVLNITSQLAIETIDIATLMQAQSYESERPLFHPNEGHLNEEGNRLVSRLLQEKLAD
jgi:lysophospholipase L1-like esterase